MILTLADAQKIDPKITQSDLDAFETTIRELTNNKFQKVNVRGRDLALTGKTITMIEGSSIGMRVGDTIEISDSTYNDGLYTISAMTISMITVTADLEFIDEIARDGIVTLIHYPADIVKGVKDLIDYGVHMGDKTGIKSETISRMSVTYYDVSATDNAEGYPSAKLDFVRKYVKMRWA